MPVSSTPGLPLDAELRPAGSMLLVLPVPFRRCGDSLLLEQQACNGLRRWGEHFTRVTLAAPVCPEAIAYADRSTVWSRIEGFPSERYTFLPLPWAYGYRAFLGTLRGVRRLLAQQIPRHTYLQFGIGYLAGDWAAVAALEAIRQRRRFVIHMDRVEHQVIVEVARTRTLARRAYARATAIAVRRYHRHLIERCALGLWHGADCFAEYSRWCSQSHLVHDVHCSDTEGIDEAALSEKLAQAASADGLRICYAGRMEAMKAPLDWLQAIAVARDLGAPISAVWYGDGTLRGAMQALIERLQLGHIVSLPGLIRDRGPLLAALRSAHLLLCTHVTRESPRCLLEALVCGTAIVGYRSRYAEDLTASLGGGTYVEPHDWRSAGRRLFEIASDRTRLCRLIGEAARNGRRFNDRSVFAERSQLIKRHGLTGAGQGASTRTCASHRLPIPP